MNLNEKLSKINETIKSGFNAMKNDLAGSTTIAGFLGAFAFTMDIIKSDPSLPINPEIAMDVSSIAYKLISMFPGDPATNSIAAIISLVTIGYIGMFKGVANEEKQQNKDLENIVEKCSNSNYTISKEEFTRLEKGIEDLKFSEKGDFVFNNNKAEFINTLKRVMTEQKEKLINSLSEEEKKDILLDSNNLAMA